MQHFLFVSVLCFQLLLSRCHSSPLPFLGANLTANVDRIKIVFTPMVCRRICHGGQCYNSCERGDKTTVYSENQGPPAKTNGFRLCKFLIVSQLVRFWIASEFLTRACFVLDKKKKSSSSLRCTEMKHFVEIPFSMLLKSERKGENRLCDCALRPKRCLEMGKPHTRPTLPPLYPLLACGLHLALNLTLTISYAQQKKKKDRGREREGERAQDLTEITLKPLLSTCFSPEPAWRAWGAATMLSCLS